MPGTAAGTQFFNSRMVFSAISSADDLLRAFLAGDGHVGFQDHAFQRDALNAQFLKRLVQNALGHLIAAVDVVIAVHQDFRLDDRDDLRGLA